ncbi:MFS general substrate transporter [Micractinium conductrix]|uniref:MFS general substrate transporter n=1 Tax=Micractinium conductrix TaxID=554055 RepID=A0A2P6V0Z5_9CHLO|nr:MFS general substrate transporter [Micractinium conductrix]|eukprot:PSC67761.1 MFS general substrate transporter [Micractinium conductrix]
MRGLGEAGRSAWRATRAGFTSLRGSPRELWIVFVLKVFESYNYFSLSRLFTLYLTEEFGVSDIRAGTLYGLWGTLLTLYGFALGGMIDVLGVKGSLVTCFVLNIASRLMMAATTSSTMFLAMLLGPNAVAGALGVPVMTIGVKRFTQVGNRGFAFSLFYSLMNVAALSQGMLMDFFRIGPLRRGFRIPSLPERSLLNNGSRLFLASGCVTSLIGLFITFTLGDSSPAPPKRPASEAGDDSVHSRRTDSSNELELPSTTSSPDAPLLGPAAGVDMPGGSSGSGAGGSSLPRHRLAAAAGKADADSEYTASGPLAATGTALGQLEGWRQRMADLLQGMAAVLASRGFYKYLCMCMFTVCLKQVFRHLDATLPKYQLRAFGCDTPVGLIYSINPAMIVLLVPVVGAMTTDLPHFDMIHYGGWVSALSPFLIVAFNTEWSTAAFVALLSLGEAIWSPRWYDYSMGVAPDGREGIFTALASAPLFAAMLPTGMVSGALLQRFCPDNGQCGDRTPDSDGSDAGSAAAQAGRRLLALLSHSGSGSSTSSTGGGPRRWLGGMAAAAAAPLLGAVSGDAAPGPVPGGSYCDGRRLWAIVGAITVSSPLLVLFTQHWLRPDPRDFHKLDAVTQGVRPSTTDGEAFDTNEADPLGLLENVMEARTLHDAERGGNSGSAPRSRPASGTQ